jgi:hypothetical protein
MHKKGDQVMDFLSGLALVMLTMVGYSSGAILTRGSKKVTPRLLDLGAVLLLWGAALATRNALGKWLAVLTWLIIGAVVSSVLTWLRRDQYSDVKPRAVAPAGDGPQQWWESWKRFSTEIGNYQSRILLAFFYFVVVTPFGLGVRLFSDPLHLRPSQNNTMWVKRQPLNESLQGAHEQS